MITGVPKEIKTREYRVALTPEGAGELADAGHTVLCETGLGQGSGFSDDMYEKAGAVIASKERLFKEASLIVKVKEPLESEYGLFNEGQAIFTFLHLAPNPGLTEMLMKKRISAFAYETLQHAGGLPLLMPMSEVAGRMAPIMGAYYLQRPKGGSGVLMAGATGVAPALTMILGAGVVGCNALKIADGLGSDVLVLNRGADALERIDAKYEGRVYTAPLTHENIARALKNADLVVGAVYARGASTPRLVTKDMLRLMKKGSVLVDVSIDQGGCFETSRPTTHDEPVYEADGILHYCVANMPGAYPKTSTMALSRATLPYVIELAGGIDKAASGDGPLRTALNVYQGRITHPGLAESTGLPLSQPESK